MWRVLHTPPVDEPSKYERQPIIDQSVSESTWTDMGIFAGSRVYMNSEGVAYRFDPTVGNIQYPIRAA